MRVRTPRRVFLARMVAVAADILQIVAFPLFLPGALSPLDDAVDLLAGGVITYLLGWHWAFLPTFLAELVPVLDLFPSWTAAVFWVTRGGGPPRFTNERVEPRLPPPPSSGLA